MTASEMIDIARMVGIYRHRESNPEVTDVLQVEDNNEKLLAEVGEAIINDDVVKFEKFITEGKVTFFHGNSIPETNAIYCLYLPPFYLFTDLKREYK